MNLKEINQLLAEAEDGLGGGLAATDVFSKQSGMSIAGIRTAPKACALFNLVTERATEAIKKSGLPIPDNLQSLIIQLGADQENPLVLIAVIELDAKYRWGLAVDLTKASLGLLVSVVLPDTIPRLRAALGSSARAS
ncbi:MAG TPA: hypothetical protein PKW35_05510 [Nannocystaceae bacterium]|nr:hypothetical protein [Nannocystaceae bacterium]